MTNKAYGSAIIWWGQIVNDEVWKSNLPATKWKYTDELPGYGTRYKVAILGRDSQNKDTPDEQLEWADVIYPVTAGSGHGGSYETANLRKGSFVFGIYRDGIHMTQPVILGCLGNNEQIPLAQSIPIKNFVPFSGYIKERVSVNNIPAEGSCPPKIKHITPNGEQEKDNKQPLEGANSQTVSSIGDQTASDDGNRGRSYSIPNTCNTVQLGKIQIEIKNFIIDIQNFKTAGAPCRWKNTILKPIKENGQEYSISEYIAFKSQNVSKFVSGEIRNLINKIQQAVKTKVNEKAKLFYSALFPNQRPYLKRNVETANDLIDCLFRKIVSNLLKLITDVLLKIAERFINTPLCAVENIIGNILGQLLGFITDAIKAILRPVEVLIGAIFDFAGGILDFIVDLLSFISCDEAPSCPESEEWTPWQGATKFNVGSNIGNIITKAKDIASSVSQITDVDNFDFNLNFDGIFENTCDVGPLFCGPPTVEFYGGGGSGASGNAIISATGDILGVDITSSGSGYTSAPTIRFVDACGKGNGAVGRAVIGQVPLRTTQGTGGTQTGGGTGTDTSGQTQTGGGGTGTGETTTGVTDVIIENPGFGYISSPDGDRGGDGRTWATRNQTTVKRADGTYDRPYNPGETFTVYPGDEVYSCGRTILITETQEYTAPECSDTSISRGDNPSLNSGKYPVFLELDKIAIDSPGINYDSTKDKIVISPDNGAKLEPVFDSNGSLKKVDVIRPGTGFTEIPKITIETESGYNAVLLPIFKVNRLGDIPDGQDIQVPQTQIISVIDCVGKIYG